jgi:hypothetical protein
MEKYLRIRDPREDDVWKEEVLDHFIEIGMRKPDGLRCEVMFYIEDEVDCPREDEQDLIDDLVWLVNLRIEQEIMGKTCRNGKLWDDCTCC